MKSLIYHVKHAKPTKRSQQNKACKTNLKKQKAARIQIIVKPSFS